MGHWQGEDTRPDGQERYRMGAAEALGTLESVSRLQNDSLR